MMSYQLLVRFIGVEHQRFMMGGKIWTVIGKDVLAKKVGGDPDVSFEYRSYHRSKVELFSTNRVQVMIVVC